MPAMRGFNRSRKHWAASHGTRATRPENPAEPLVLQNPHHHPPVLRLRFSGFARFHLP
jgi:hypothetical protein